MASTITESKSEQLQYEQQLAHLALLEHRRLPPTPSGSLLSEDGDGETVTGAPHDIDTDAESILSMVSYPDPAGRKGFTVSSDEPAETVYEAWEIISGKDSMVRNSWKSVCGIDFGVKWRSLDDGFVGLNAIISYEQGELAALHADAVQEYEAKSSKKARSYAQDLANRVDRLPEEVYNNAQHLMDYKTKATNKTPYRRREWRIIILEESEFQMTELLPERKKKGILRRHREEPTMRRWFLVLRGEEVKTTKAVDGWRLFGRFSNPWWRIDVQETREARKEHREYFAKLKAVQTRGPPRYVTRV
ncbi:hypothetical protein AAE478_002955 [Parahypoxylon ruwenzoriense]